MEACATLSECRMSLVILHWLYSYSNILKSATYCTYPLLQRSPPEVAWGRRVWNILSMLMYFVRPLSQHYYHTQSCALASQLFGIHVSNSLYIGADYIIWHCCVLTSLIVYDTKNYLNL